MLRVTYHNSLPVEVADSVSLQTPGRLLAAPIWESVSNSWSNLGLMGQVSPNISTQRERAMQSNGLLMFVDRATTSRQCPWRATHRFFLCVCHDRHLEARGCGEAILVGLPLIGRAVEVSGQKRIGASVENAKKTTFTAETTPARNSARSESTARPPVLIVHP